MTAQRAASRSRSRQSAPKRPGSTIEAPLSVSATDSAGTRVSTWRLWFPAEPCVRRGKTTWRYPPNTNERRRLHHMAEAREVKAWRQRAHALAWAIAATGPHQRIRVSAVVYRPRIGSADPDGDISRTKPLLDGLVDAGVVPNDTHAHVEIGAVREARSLNGERGLELIVEVLG